MLGLSWPSLSRSSRSNGSAETRRRLQARRRRVVLESLEERVVLSTFTWSGASSDWTSPQAWTVDGSPATGIPGAGDDVVFNGTGVTNAVSPGDATTVRSVTITSDYTGALSLGGDFKANYGFTQAGGTFVAGANTLTVGRDLTVSSGAFNAGTGTVEIFAGPIGASSKVDAPGVTFRNVTLDLGSHHINVGVLDVNGTLSLKGFNTLTGTIHAGGDVITSAGGSHSNRSSGVIVIDGAGTQALRTVNPTDANGYLPSIEIDKPNGTLNLSGGLNVQGNWTQVRGGLNAGSSTVTFLGGTNTVDTGNRSLNNVVIDTSIHHFNVKKLDVNGDFTIKTATNIRFVDGAVTGALTVAGNLTSNDGTVAGNASIVMDGTGHATLQGGDFPDGGIIIDKGVYNVTVSAMNKALDGPLTLESLANLHGDLLVAKNVITKDSSVAGNGYIVFSGDGDQTLTASTPGNQVPGVKIDKTGGTLTLNPSHTIGVTGHWYHENGAVNTTGSTIELKPSGHTTVVTDDRMAFNNLIVDIADNYWLNAATNMAVDGTLTIRTVSAINGTIVARGDVVTEDATVGGSGLLIFSGGKNQTLTAAATLEEGQVPAVKIDKTAGTLTLAGTNKIGVTGGWEYVKGGLNAAASTIALAGSAHRTVYTGPTANTALHNVEIRMGTYNLNAMRLDVDGDLTIHSVSGINGASGAVTVAGNLTSNDGSVGGTADITMDGTKDANIKGGDFPNGGIVIQKGSAQSVDANVTKSLTGPLTIKSLSNLTGVFHVAGDVFTNDTSVGGNGLLVFDGTNNQRLTATTPGGQVPGVKIDKERGTFTVAPANRIGVTGPQGWQEVQGVVVTTGSTVEFRHVSKAVKASTPFNNVILNLGSADTLDAEDMTVNGTLTITSLAGINGMIQARGDVVTGDTSVGGTGGILFNGAGAQKLSASVDRGQVPNVVIYKPNGSSLTLAGENTISVSRNWTHNSGGVVTTGSMVEFRHTSKTVQSGGYAFNNVILNLGSADTLNADDMTVNGTLTITSLAGINGMIQARGDVVTGDTSVGGTGGILFNGAGAQKLSASVDRGQVPNVVIDKPNGSLTLAGENTISVSRNWTHKNGGVITTGSTVEFRHTSKTVQSGGYAFNDVILNLGSADTLDADDMTVNGTLTITSLAGINGVINVHGDLESTDSTVSGNGVIRLVGDADAMITGRDFPNGGIIVDKTGGTSVHVGAGLSNLSRLEVISGTLNLGGNVLTVNGAALIGSNGALAFSLTPGVSQLNVTNGPLTFAAGSLIAITYGGSAFDAYNVISVASGSLLDGGVTFDVPDGLTPMVTPGSKGNVRVVKAS